MPSVKLSHLDIMLDYKLAHSARYQGVKLNYWSMVEFLIASSSILCTASSCSRAFLLRPHPDAGRLAASPLGWTCVQGLKARLWGGQSQAVECLKAKEYGPQH